MISICFQADLETDEVYAQMTLQPVTSVSVFSLLFLLKTYLDILLFRYAYIVIRILIGF
jgi:hypothetical protein